MLLNEALRFCKHQQAKKNMGKEKVMRAAYTGDPEFFYEMLIPLIIIISFGSLGP